RPRRVVDEALRGVLGRRRRRRRRRRGGGDRRGRGRRQRPRGQPLVQPGGQPREGLGTVQRHLRQRIGRLDPVGDQEAASVGGARPVRRRGRGRRDVIPGLRRRGARRRVLDQHPPQQLLKRRGGRIAAAREGLAQAGGELGRLEPLPRRGRGQGLERAGRGRPDVLREGG